MTEDDILNGRLIVEIGIAPTRPAEFVVLKLHQKTRGATSWMSSDPSSEFGFSAHLARARDHGMDTVPFRKMVTDP